jgi:hypothetical protein
MPPEMFDALVTYAARVLEFLFCVGAGGSAIVFVLAAYDIVTDALKPEVHENIEKREIDAVWRAA